MKLSRHKRKSQSGASMVETMIVLIVLCWIFFGAMQIFQWAFTRMFCDYSSFYAAKAFSLGYAKRTIVKAARIAALPISGPDKDGLLKLPRRELETRLRDYMTSGNAGIEFDYWDAPTNSPDLRMSHVIFSDSEIAQFNYIKTRMTLHKAPFLTDNFGNFLRVTCKSCSCSDCTSPSPFGECRTIDHSAGWGE